MNNFDVITFGSAVVDSFVKTKFNEEKDHIIIPYGCKMLIDKLFFEIGGGGTNTAVAFSRFGLKTGYIGKVGSDKTGEKILNLLKKEKIKFLGKKIKGETSGFSVVLMTRKHHRSILTYKGVNNEIEKKDIQKFKTKWLYLSSLLEKSFKTQINLAKKLKKQGVKIAFNPSEYQIKRVNLKPLLNLADVLILNKLEAGLFTKKKNKLKEIYNLGPKIVVITDERNPVYAYDGKKEYKINPPKTNLVDKTGAGDAFASGFIAGLIKNKSIEDSLKLGIKEATSVVKHLGAKNNLIKMKLK